MLALLIGLPIVAAIVAYWLGSGIGRPAPSKLTDHLFGAAMAVVALVRSVVALLGFGNSLAGIDD